MPRETSKSASFHILFRCPRGASRTQLQSATHWQSHSLRAALTRLRKAGQTIERLPPHKTGGARYRITDATAGPR